MAENASKFSEIELCCEIIPATLKPWARVQYLKEGVKNLRTKMDVLELLEHISKGIEAENEVASSKIHTRYYKSGGSKGPGKSKSGGRDGKESNKN